MLSDQERLSFISSLIHDVKIENGYHIKIRWIDAFKYAKKLNKIEL